MWRKNRVVLLEADSDENVQLWFDKRDGDDFDLLNHNPNSEEYKPCHLYVISDEEINIGDWLYNPFHDEVVKVTNLDWVKIHKDKFKKVVASTDPTLEIGFNQCDGCVAKMPMDKYGTHKDHQAFGIGCTKHLYLAKLPIIPASFIEQYYKVFSPDEDIVTMKLVDEVDVKYFDSNNILSPFYKWEPMTNNDNEIIIKIHIPNYTKQGILKLLNKGGFSNEIVYNYLEEKL